MYFSGWQKELNRRLAMKRLMLTQGRSAVQVHLVGLLILASVLGVAGCSREHNPLASNADGQQADAYVDIFVGNCGGSDAWIKVDTVADPVDGTRTVRVTVAGVIYTEPNWQPDGGPVTPSWPEWTKLYQRKLQLKQDSMWQFEDTCDTYLNNIKGYNPYRYSVHGIITPTRISGEEYRYALKSDGTEQCQMHVSFQGEFARMLVKDLPLACVPSWPDDEDDGIVPEPWDSLAVSSNLWSVASNGHLLVAAGSRIVTSTDGATWFARAATQEWLQKVIWTGAQFVAVGRGGLIVTSPDGMTWTSRWNNMEGSFGGVACGGNAYVVVGPVGHSLSSQIVTSRDGVTWQSQTIDIQILTDVVWTGSCFLATSSASSAAAVSPDGVQWTSADIGYSLSDILLDSSQIVAVRYTSERTEFYQGASLYDWSLMSTLDTVCIKSIAFDGTTYVAAGAGPINQWGAKIFVSTDLKNWTLKISMDRGLFEDVIWTGSRFVAVGLGVTAASPDGQTWDVKNL